MAGGGKIVARHETPDGPRFDVEMDDGEMRRGMSPADLAPEDDAGAEPEGSTNRSTKAPDGEPAKFFDYELRAGGVTVNEWRASKGLPPDARFGAMTFPEYQEEHAVTFATAAAAATGDIAPDPGGEPEASDGAAP